MELAIERLTALALIVVGLSHLVAPSAWISLFTRMREMGAAGGLLNALMHFPLGLMIVAFHPVWSGRGLLVTALGVGLIVKCLVYFLHPDLVERSLAKIAPERAWQCRVAGGFGVALGSLIGAWTM